MTSTFSMRLIVVSPCRKKHFQTMVGNVAVLGFSLKSMWRCRNVNTSGGSKIASESEITA
jgi:hypothetical protein